MILNMSEELNTKTLGDELWQAPANSEITKAEFEEKSQEVMEKILEKNNFDKTSKEYEKFFKELMSQDKHP